MDSFEVNVKVTGDLEEFVKSAFIKNVLSNPDWFFSGYFSLYLDTQLPSSDFPNGSFTLFEANESNLSSWNYQIRSCLKNGATSKKVKYKGTIKLTVAPIYNLAE